MDYNEAIGILKMEQVFETTHLPHLHNFTE